MKAKKEQDDSCVTIPLLLGSKDVGTKQAEKVEEQYNNIGSGTTSFMSTCFNGLNALSGNNFF